MCMCIFTAGCCSTVTAATAAAVADACAILDNDCWLPFLSFFLSFAHFSATINKLYYAVAHAVFISTSASSQ